MNQRRVVVTGIGTINPLGNNVAEYFAALERGASAAAPISYFDAHNFKTRFACEIKNYDWARYFDRKEVRKYDRFAQYAMVAVDEAMQDSGLEIIENEADRVGVIWSTGIGGLTSFFEEVMDYSAGDGTPRFSPFFVPRMIPDLPAGYISIKYGLKGPNYCVSSACASSNHGMISALDQIRCGRADVMIAGGSEACINIPTVGGFNSMMALSTRNDDPATASRPFDKSRDGFVLGEGAAAIILEEYEHAKARGAKIYCEFAGAGMSADAHHMTAPHPEGLGAVKSMQDALNEASLSTAEVDYINAHGTSTPLGDVAEIKAIEHLFGQDVYGVNISSTKSMTGHLLGAAAAIEALACICAIERGIVPPTINVEELDPAIDSKLNLTLGEAQQRDVRVAMSNTFGFGGHNSTVVFRKL